MAANNSHHLLKKGSLFAMFCLSYFPLFLLLSLKVFLENSQYAHYNGLNFKALIAFFVHFGFILLMVLLSCFAFAGTYLTFRKIRDKQSNAYPVTVQTIKSRNDEALSYLATYVIPLMAQGEVGAFEYVTFLVLFIIYYRLYSTSSLIVINPILNMKYGLYEIDYKNASSNEHRNVLIISSKKWIDEGEDLLIIKLSHRLYFAY